MGRLAIAAACLLALLLPASASAAPTFQSFPLPVADSRPDGITPGPDGALWFAETNKNRIRSITTDGTISGPVTAFDGPTAIASATGYLWVAEPGGAGTLGRNLPSETTVTKLTVSSAAAEPMGVAAGPDGAVWFTDHKRDVIGRMTAAGVATDVAATVGSKPWRIAPGPDGNLWFTEQGGNGTIGRLTPGGVATSFPIPTSASEPTEIVAGADGALWFTERAVDKIGRITTDGQVTEFSGMSGSQPSGIALGADGNVWFTEESGWIGRITPAGAIADWPVPGTSQPHGIALGPDGHLWFADQGLHAIGLVTSGPGVDASLAADAGDTTATFRGAVRPASQATSYYFEYGRTGGYGSATPAQNAGAGSGPVNVSATVSGLLPQTTYHYRLVAANGTDTTYGPDRTLDTKASNPLVPVPPALDQAPVTTPAPAAPVPELGKSVVVGPANGTVKVRLAGSKSFVALAADVSVPTGSELDTTKGTVTLVSAVDTRGHTQTGTFSGGRFLVRQSRNGRGMIDLYLRGPKPAPCSSAPNRASSSAVSRKKRTRRLWGRDDHGRFRTHGSDSVATVRGTRWLTEDRCDGTLTRVTQGSVSVRNAHTRRTKVVRAGHSYLARRG